MHEIITPRVRQTTLGGNVFAIRQAPTYHYLHIHTIALRLRDIMDATTGRVRFNRDGPNAQVQRPGARVHVPCCQHRDLSLPPRSYCFAKQPHPRPQELQLQWQGLKQLPQRWFLGPRPTTLGVGIEAENSKQNGRDKRGSPPLGVPVRALWSGCMRNTACTMRLVRKHLKPFP